MVFERVKQWLGEFQHRRPTRPTPRNPEDDFDKESQKEIVKFLNEFNGPIGIGDVIGVENPPDVLDQSEKEDYFRDTWVERTPMEWFEDLLFIIHPKIASQAVYFYRHEDEWNYHVPQIVAGFAEKDEKSWVQSLYDYRSEETWELILRAVRWTSWPSTRPAELFLEKIWAEVPHFPDERMALLVEALPSLPNEFSKSKIEEVRALISEDMPLSREILAESEKRNWR